MSVTYHDLSASRQGAAIATLHHAHIFVWAFALSSIWHYASSAQEIYSYWLHYDALITPLIALAIGTALVALLWPGNALALMVFSLGQLIAIVGRMPFVADHLVMEALLHTAILVALAGRVWRSRSFNLDVTEVFDRYAPIGRWLLIIMYFFGTFHKINPGFLSLDASCAVPFIQGLFLPEGVIQQPVIRGMAIYGTLVFEALAMILLFWRRTKYYGMLLGIPFHYIIGISGYGTLAHFSSFALALHLLFAAPSMGQRILADERFPAFFKNPLHFRVLTLVIFALQIGFAFYLGYTHNGMLVNMLFGIYGAVLIYAVVRHARHRKEDGPYRLRSPMMLLNVIPLVYFLHCLGPYVGLSTGGTLQMFSGLRTEGGVSNHYVLPKLPQWFSYQDDVIYFKEANNPSLQMLAQEKQGMVMFDFQRHFTQHETISLPFTVVINGETSVVTDRASFEAFVRRYFKPQSWWERKYLSFRLVDDVRPMQCRH